MSTFRPLVAVVIAIASMLVAACSKKGASPESETAQQPVAAEPETTVTAEQEGAPMEEPEPEPVAAAPEPPRLSDAQITKVLMAVDTSEIEQAKVVQRKSKNPKVKKFAQHMIQEHTKSKQKGTKLAKKAKLTPEDSDLSARLTGKATALLDQLKAADASSIDALYISGQAQQHQEVLDLISAQLIPSAENDELKSHLADARNMVEGHAERARELSEGVTGAGAGASTDAAGGMSPATMSPGMGGAGGGAAGPARGGAGEAARDAARGRGATP